MLYLMAWRFNGGNGIDMAGPNYGLWFHFDRVALSRLGFDAWRENRGEAQVNGIDNIYGTEACLMKARFYKSNAPIRIEFTKAADRPTFVYFQAFELGWNDDKGLIHFVDPVMLVDDPANQGAFVPIAPSDPNFSEFQRTQAHSQQGIPEEVLYFTFQSQIQSSRRFRLFFSLGGVQTTTEFDVTSAGHTS